MNNEPVAWMYAVNGIWTAFSDELPPDDAYDKGTLTPLYTHPVKELDIKYDVTVKWDDKTTHHTNVSGDTPLHHTHSVKELTQGEIHAVWASGSYYTLDKEGNVDEVRFEEFAKAVIKKAREK